jgi:hypothetical protein
MNSSQILINDVYIPYLSNTKRYLHLWGGSGCFEARQLVVTKKGDKPISEIEIGDEVFCHNHKTGNDEFCKVTYLHKYDNPIDKIYRIKMKDGIVIEVTENHHFFSGGAYLKIKDILLSLQNENMEKNT